MFDEYTPQTSFERAMVKFDDVQLVRKEEAEEDDSQQTSTSSRSPLRLSDTSALALRMSRRLESSEQSASQQSDETAVADASEDGECRDGTEVLRGPTVPQGPGDVGSEASLGDGDEGDETSDADEADSWLLEILDMQARMHGWFDIIRSAVLPPREAARLEELRAGCARAPSVRVCAAVSFGTLCITQPRRGVPRPCGDGAPSMPRQVCRREHAAGAGRAASAAGQTLRPGMRLFSSAAAPPLSVGPAGEGGGVSEEAQGCSCAWSTAARAA